MPLLLTCSVPLPVMVAVWPAVKVPATRVMAKEATVNVLSTSMSLDRTLPEASVSSKA